MADVCVLAGAGGGALNIVVPVCGPDSILYILYEKSGLRDTPPSACGLRVAYF